MTVAGVVGLDLSVTSTGMARMPILGAGKGEVFFHKAFGSKSADMTPLQRYVHVFNGIRKYSKRDDVFFIEDYAYGAPQKMWMLGELNGIVKLMLTRWCTHKMEPMLVNQGTWKKFISGNGALKKDEFKLWIYKRTNTEVKTNDEAAAMSIAMFGMHVIRGNYAKEYEKSKLNKVQVKLIQKYRKENKDKVQALAKLLDNAV